MKKILIALLLSTTVFASGKIQDNDIGSKSYWESLGSSQIKLPHTSKVYDETNGQQLSVSIANGSLASSITENKQVGTSYTLLLTDKGKCVSMNNASSIGLMIPPNSSVAFPVGTIIPIMQVGSGRVTVVPGVGVTVKSLSNFTSLNGNGAHAYLQKTLTNDWYLYGDLTTNFITATGGTITTDGDYKVHTFTSSGTFQITAGSGSVDSLVVSGGGSGGNDSGTGGGGGGAGGLTYTSPGAVYGVGSYSVTVGAGGSSYSNGSSSSFDIIGTIGGGRGGRNSAAANSGGSGGGATTGLPGSFGSGTGGQGFAGGSGANGVHNTGGGGGGAGGLGGNSNDGTGTGGAGGIGVSNSITGSAVVYASGGGGGGQLIAGTASAGGGGNGGAAGGEGTAGSANTGGGGGGGQSINVNGGSGIVVLRYKFQ